MKKNYFLVFIAFLLFGQHKSFAQIVGGSLYLQGQFLEVGEANTGALGVCTAPPGYHTHCPTCFPTTMLAEVYDYGHDGWTVGTPAYMGDYTQPGTPYEGWAMQINGVTPYYANLTFGSCGSNTYTTPLPPTVPGSITSYTNSGGSIAGLWTGAVSGLNIVAETRVDTTGSAIVFTVKFYNTNPTPLVNVFYERTCDPDNTSSWTIPAGSGGSDTKNVIVHQNELPNHAVMVSSVGDLPTNYTNFLNNAPYSYMALGTKDCRAVAVYYSSHSTPFGAAGSGTLAPAYNYTTNTPSQLWNGTATNCTTGLGDSDFVDCGIGLVFNLGTLSPAGTPGDSAVISFAYIFNGNTGLDSAFPDPQLRITNASTDTSYPGVAIGNIATAFDTFDVCAHPGDTLVVDVLHGMTRDWTWSHWTWAPSIGLTANTGAIDTIITTALAPVTTYTITGTDSSGTGVMQDCHNRIIYLTIKTCNNCVNNSPCEGDTLKLYDKGDSTGRTYLWTGPGGYTSTQQDPIRLASTLSMTGWYYVTRTYLGVSDRDSTYATIHPLPVVNATSNSPLCTTPLQTLQLNATPVNPGETFSWTGPGGYTSPNPNPTRALFSAADTGIYKVVTVSDFGCKDSATTDAGLIAPPPAPEIHGDTQYCQGAAFVPFHLTDSFNHNMDTFGHWYVSPSGGLSTTTAPIINTNVPGTYHVYASVIIGSCESPRASYTVRVVSTPTAPLVTGRMDYCQFVGPFAPVNVITSSPADTIKWYTASSPAIDSEPQVDLTIAQVNHYWVTQSDSGCESPRRPVDITVHPKPAPPTVHPHPWCQYQIPSPVSATATGAGDVLLWYGPGVTVGTTSAPTPSTTVAPDTINYYVTETSSFGCVSDSAIDKEIIIKKPAPPITSGVYYCQHSAAIALSAQVDSAARSYLNWYYDATALPGNPVPFTDTIPGVYTWYVSQTVNTCESDSAAVNVTIIYKPVFSIAASQNYVCQFDSISLKYAGPQLVAPSYSWSLPQGIHFAAGSHVYDDSVLLVFDSATIFNNVVTLTASDDSGKCSSDTSIRIKIVPRPSAQAFTKHDVCLGDTVLLALSGQSDNANTYTWYIDYVSLQNATALSVISANSNSGGPFSISWVDSGRHTIEVHSFTEEGCKSLPWYDTINVHMKPDAHFHITSLNAGECIEDSVQFTADVADYNNLYTWAPAHAFENINSPVEWGRVEEAKSIITLLVTDPFGCTATSELEVDPGSCCKVGFPNAFTPNGDTHDDYFRPLYNGYHHFHVFRILNRWGQVVFNSENSDVRWDGTYNGVPQDMGTYYYYIKYDCGGKTIEDKGSLTLIR